MDERLQFVARRLSRRADGGSLQGVWDSPGKTGYKIFERYQECGVQGLTDRSRCPHHYAHNILPFQVENYTLNVKREHPTWGCTKDSWSACAADSRGSRFRPRAPSMRCWIATAWSSAAAIFVVERKARRSPWASVPTNLWCTDYKGEFLLGNRQYCYPLTVTDHASRYLFTCEALSSTREEYAFTVFERLFKERGLPAVHPQR